MSPRLKIALFVVLSVAQVAAAGWSILRFESILASGTPYKVRAAPVDPADAFRGRYVVVSPSITMAAPIAAETEQLLRSIQSGERKAYVRLAKDAQGFASAAEIVARAPQDGDYLEIDYASPIFRPRSEDPDKSDLTGYALVFSFDRYYMNETAAPEAQRRSFDTRRNVNSASTIWLTVRVKDGAAVIEGLFVDGIPIEEFVRR